MVSAVLFAVLSALETPFLRTGGDIFAYLLSLFPHFSLQLFVC